MKPPETTFTTPHAFPSRSLYDEVIEGLRKTPKTLPCKLKYDEYGSHLFEKICDQDEYYLTRTEMSIMNENIQDIANSIRPNAALVEFGSGNSKKTQLLLRCLQDLRAYVPIDISREILMSSSRTLQSQFPNLEIHPVCADYTQPFSLPTLSQPIEQVVVYFPGSTIGNFETDQTVTFLQRIYQLTGREGALLIGVDLLKEKSLLEAAYNDQAGVTAAFNSNILNCLNREFHANFDLNQFRHCAVFNPGQSRIEMYNISLKNQAVRIGEGKVVTFETHEPIRTGYSHKYSLSQFQKLAQQAGFKVQKTWLDPKRLFSVQLLKGLHY